MKNIKKKAFYYIERKENIMQKISNVGKFVSSSSANKIIDLFIELAKDYNAFLQEIVIIHNKTGDNTDINLFEDKIKDLKNKAMTTHEYSELFDILSDSLELNENFLEFYKDLVKEKRR